MKRRIFIRRSSHGTRERDETSRRSMVNPFGAGFSVPLRIGRRKAILQTQTLDAVGYSRRIGRYGLDLRAQQVVPYQLGSSGSGVGGGTGGGSRTEGG